MKSSDNTSPELSAAGQVDLEIGSGSNSTNNNNINDKINDDEKADSTSSSEAIPESSIQQTAMNGFAGLGFISSFISMMSEYSATAIQHPAILISGCLGIILSPYAKFQQEKLTQVKALQQTNTVLENELLYLQEQHETIQKHVSDITATTDKLNTLQSTLSYIQTNQNQLSIQQLEQQVEESKRILSQCQQNTQGIVLQNLISILIKCDTNHTMTLDDNEINTLIQSLESIHNVQIKEDKIRQVILDNNRSITSIMEIARNAIMNTTTSLSPVAATSTSNKITTTPTSPNVTTTSNNTNGSTTEYLPIESIFSYIETQDEKKIG